MGDWLEFVAWGEGWWVGMGEELVGFWDGGCSGRFGRIVGELGFIRWALVAVVR